MIGDSRHLPLKNESVNCIITSPPYWGLRKYDIPDLIWDGEEGCEHEWEMENGEFDLRTAKGDYPKKNEYGVRKWQRGFCLHCSAWRGSLGLEPTPELYVGHIVEIFREVKRVLRKDGTLWLNLGDSYAGSGCGTNDYRTPASISLSKPILYDGPRPQNKVPPGLKPKDLVGIPWRVAFALQADGWYLRSDIIWSKPNPMPESVTDRPTKAHEYVFLLAKSQKYYFDQEAVREPHVRLWDENNGGSISTGRMVGAGGAMGDMSTHPKGYPLPNPNGRNIRTVWTIPTQPYKEAHFATFPEKLIEPCIKAGTSEKGRCRQCGSPWERVVKKEGETTTEKRKRLNYSEKRGIGGNLVSQNLDYAGGHGNNIRETQTLGWQPTRECGGDPVPCIVLDPFCGSGTTMRVAEKLNRIGIGFDLGYKELQDHRMRLIQKQLL